MKEDTDMFETPEPQATPEPPPTSENIQPAFDDATIQSLYEQEDEANMELGRPNPPMSDKYQQIAKSKLEGS